MSDFKLIKGSCLEQEVDAVVNAANRYLRSGGGICGAIFQKAGYTTLNEACQQFNVPLNDGDAVITPAFDLNNARFIIHAVGPDFNVKPNAFKDLENAYYNSLIVLKNNNLYSIAFPLISAGIYGGNLTNPVMESTKQCIKAYNKFIKEYEDYEINVILCAFSESEFIEAKNVVDKGV